MSADLRVIPLEVVYSEDDRYEWVDPTEPFRESGLDFLRWSRTVGKAHFPEHPKKKTYAEVSEWEKRAIDAVESGDFGQLQALTEALSEDAVEFISDRFLGAYKLALQKEDWKSVCFLERTVVKFDTRIHSDKTALEKRFKYQIEHNNLSEVEFLLEKFSFCPRSSNVWKDDYDFDFVLIGSHGTSLNLHKMADFARQRNRPAISELIEDCICSELYNAFPINHIQHTVVETTSKSWTAPLLYEPTVYYIDGIPAFSLSAWLGPIPFIGIAVGIYRIAVATIHTAGHLLIALIKQDRGHFYHAKQGGNELLKGVIQATPIIGRMFCFKMYHYKRINWYGIKFYNPMSPDALDKEVHLWRGVRGKRPGSYIKA